MKDKAPELTDVPLEHEILSRDAMIAWIASLKVLVGNIHTRDWSMTPKKPAPDLIRGGNRPPEKRAV
jgi:hypothetical protein